MAPPRKPENERKTATGVSLTRTQRETLHMMGGSPWLQNILDRERALIDRGRKVLPQFIRLDVINTAKATKKRRTA